MVYINFMRNSLQKKNKNRNLSKKNNQKGGHPTRAHSSPYLYLIYTEAICEEGTYLYHVRYIGFNLKHVFQYYHALHSEYTELLQERRVTSSIHPITLRQGRAFNEIGRYYTNLPGQNKWLQNPSDPYSSAQIINAFQFRSVLRRNTIDHFVQSGLNDAYDTYFPNLVQFNIASNRINRSNFFDPEIDEIEIDNLDVPYEDRLYNLIDGNNVLPTTYELINETPIIQEKIVTFEFRDHLGMFDSEDIPDDETKENVRNIVNKMYPNAKELNSIKIMPSERNNLNVILSNASYTFKISEVGLDVSAYNIVLSNKFLDISIDQETPLAMASLAPISKVMTNLI
jgi:hypothetical protein